MNRFATKGFDGSIYEVFEGQGFYAAPFDDEGRPTTYPNAAWTAPDSAAVLATACVKPMTGPDAPIGGTLLVSDGEPVELQDGTFHLPGVYEAVPVLTFDHLKANKKAAIEQGYTQRMQAGFPYTFAGDKHETLQVKPEDQTNWLTLKDAARDAIAAGAGAMACQPPIRVTSNALYAVPWTEVVTILNLARTWGGTMMGVSWALKDAVAAAPDIATLNAINIDAAPWPA